MYILESIRHLDNFPFKLFIANINTCCFHWHYDYELVLVLKGLIKISAHNRNFNLERGGFCVLNSGEVHSILSLRSNLCLFLQFSPDIFNRIGSSKRNYIFNVVSHQNIDDPNINRSIFSMLNIALSLRDKKLGYELYAEGAFYQLVANLLKSKLYYIAQNSPIVSYENEIELLNQLNDFIKTHFAERINVKDVCKALAVSPTVIYTYLKQTIGMTIGDLIRYYRIREAKGLLLETQHTIYHIAYLCGFTNEVSFYRSFKKELGVTPNEFRKRGDFEPGLGPIQGYSSFNAHEAYELIMQIKNSVALNLSSHE